MPDTISGAEDMAIDKTNKNSALKEFVFWLGMGSYLFLKCCHLKHDKELMIFLQQAF